MYEALQTGLGPIRSDPQYGESVCAVHCVAWSKSPAAALRSAAVASQR